MTIVTGDLPPTNAKTVLATITNSTKWYAPNVGVVKNEQYNNNNQLQYYTVLEVVK